MKLEARQYTLEFDPYTLSQGDKIAAIKAVREVVRSGLKDSKHFIEGTHIFEMDLRCLDPEGISEISKHLRKLRDALLDHGTLYVCEKKTSSRLWIRTSVDFAYRA